MTRLFIDGAEFKSAVAGAVRGLGRTKPIKYGGMSGVVEFEDVKCQFCGLLVEDMWSMTVQHVVMSKERDNVGRESREWLEDLCRIPSPLHGTSTSTRSKRRRNDGGHQRPSSDVTKAR